MAHLSYIHWNYTKIAVKKRKVNTAGGGMRRCILPVYAAWPLQGKTRKARKGEAGVESKSGNGGAFYYKIPC